MRTSALLVSVSALWLAAAPSAALGHDTIARSTATIVFCVYASPSLPPGTLEQAVTVASELLWHAGVANAWHNCDAQPEACGPAVVIDSVVVRFTTGTPWRERGCGWAARKRGSNANGFISIERDCVAHFQAGISRQLDVPEDANRFGGKMLGAILAHEVGHILGLRHANAGLMRLFIGEQEWHALARGRLGFSAEECQQMAAALRHQPAATRVSR